MNVKPALDVSQLDTEEFGHRDTLWWGNMGLILAESTSIALLIASYFFLRMRYTEWPPADAGLPWWNFSLVNLALMLVITVPMRRIEVKAPHADKMRLAKMLGLCAVLITASLILRIFEFEALQTDWKEHSYGSITWALLFVHAIEIFVSAGESGMLAVYSAVKPLDRKHRADIQVNCVFWYFVLISWIVIFAVVWLAARVL